MRRKVNRIYLKIKHIQKKNGSRNKNGVDIWGTVTISNTHIIRFQMKERKEKKHTSDGSNENKQ